ncbi:EAL domain-containing protein [Amphritea japonica]|uniref:EAL domain-containing protein n=1 Tax=Amphritea japonica TaxID=452627 RepID=UPI0003A10871|nr:EAL domain-containing protein [Amphritea japonica]
MLILSVSVNAAIPLTTEEQRWLAKGDPIKVGVAIIPPYLSNKGGGDTVEGMSLDYLKLIEVSLGVEFQYQVFKSYGAMMEAAKQHSIDVVFAASNTEERRDYLDFTQVYSHLANKIFTQKGRYQQAEMSDFTGKQFAVPRGTALVGYIRTNYPGIELVQVDDLGEAFNLLSAGQIEGVGSYASAGYLYSVLEGIDNISIVGSVGYDYHISFASRNDQPLLGVLLEKALSAVSIEQKAEIERRWVQPEDTQRIDKETYVSAIILLGFVLAIAGLLIVVFWNRSLKREVLYRQEIQKEVSFLAYHDELTGAYNRQFLIETLSEYTRLAFSNDRSTCVILLGLDNFSLINEFHGQKIGDYVLRRMSKRLNSRLSGDAVLSRTGGDEFTVLLRQANNQVVLSHLADLLIAEISSPIAYGDQSFSLTATAGISIQTEELSEPLRLLEQADLALHEAKRKNRGGYLFYALEMSDKLQEREQLANALSRALRTEQFYLDFQPQVALDTGEVVGFEALARWQHPDQGNIRPDKFIALAEQEGLIVTLGDRVLRLACEQGREWLDQGLEFQRIAVNVSVKQFIETDYVSKVLNTLEQTGFPPSKLELELTESVFMGDRDLAKETMDKLTRQGICFAIDDFGTGFSSLLYLKELPVSKLKLDQGFIRGITKDHSSLQIVKASLQMGHALSMDVIAEGVETIEEQGLLTDLHCQQAQGYLFSRPLKSQLITADKIAQIERNVRLVTEA